MGQMNETGEIPVSIFQNDNIVARAKDNGRPVDLTWPAEGLPTEPGGVALMKSATHPNAGKLLLDWWVGKEGQEILIKSYKYSARNDISPPKGYPPLSSLKLWEENIEHIDKNRVEITKRISRSLGD
jgi:iron(III) transport system substrate-binding protein